QEHLAGHLRQRIAIHVPYLLSVKASRVALGRRFRRLGSSICGAPVRRSGSEGLWPADYGDGDDGRGPMKYMMLPFLPASRMWDEEGDVIEGPDEDVALEAWDKEMVARGILVGGGVLRSAREAKRVQVRGGELLISDGPYAETKEQMAGYAILECASMDDAI